MIFFAKLPCLDRTGLHAALSGNDDNRAVRGRQALLRLADKIKIAGCVEHVDFLFIPFDRNDRKAHGEAALLFFLVKVADRIAVSDGSMIDGMVYTVGVASASPLRGLLAKTIEDILRVNFTSFMLAVSLFTKKKYSHGGSVVALSAANAHYPQKCMSVYAASKAAIEAAVQSMAIELRDLNIRINAVIPGATDTPMTDSLDDAVVESIVKRQLLGIIDPRDIASAVCFLLSEDSKAITGRSMYVDGGMLGQ